MPEVDLYRKITAEYYDATHANLKIGDPRLSYTAEEEMEIEYPIEQRDRIELNNGNSTWAPNENELHYSQEFYIGNPSAFFGKEKITDSENKIGIAVHIYSRTSKFQETVVLDGSIEDSPNEKNLLFDYRFEKGTLRGAINLDFFFYLKESNKNNLFQANEVGLRLSQADIFSTQLIIDGNGSTFPITETDNPGGPLWQIKKLWKDPMTDPFNASSVQIELNRKHKNYNMLEKNALSKDGVYALLMTQIVAQSIAMIIVEARRDVEDENEYFEIEDASDGSIMKVVDYWADIYGIDIRNDNIMEVFNKVFEGMKEQYNEN